MVRTSHLLLDLLAQQARGLHQKDDDQNTKHNGVAKLGAQIGLAEGLDNAEEDTAQHSPGDRANAAENRRSKGPDAGHRAGGGLQGRHRGAQQHPGDGRQGRADGKGGGDGLVHIDAHELGSVPVLGDGPHGLAGPGPGGEPGQPQHNDDGSGNGVDHLTGDHQLASGQAQGRKGHNGGKVLGAGGPNQLGGVLQEVADADGRDQHRQAGSAPQGLIGQSLNQDAQQRAHHHSRQNGHKYRQPQIVGHAEGNVSSHHDDITMGEIQHLGNAVHHGIAQGNDGVNGAHGKKTAPSKENSPVFKSCIRFSTIHPKTEKA